MHSLTLKLAKFSQLLVWLLRRQRGRDHMHCVHGEFGDASSQFWHHHSSSAALQWAFVVLVSWL